MYQLLENRLMLQNTVPRHTQMRESSRHLHNKLLNGNSESYFYQRTGSKFTNPDLKLLTLVMFTVIN
jgi:hypothetical protein